MRHQKTHWDRPKKALAKKEKQDICHVNDGKNNNYLGSTNLRRVAP